jgi:hypothetical protein
MGLQTNPKQDGCWNTRFLKNGLGFMPTSFSFILKDGIDGLVWLVTF